METRYKVLTPLGECLVECTLDERGDLRIKDVQLVWGVGKATLKALKLRLEEIQEDTDQLKLPLAV